MFLKLHSLVALSSVLFVVTARVAIAVPSRIVVSENNKSAFYTLKSYPQYQCYSRRKGIAVGEFRVRAKVPSEKEWVSSKIIVNDYVKKQRTESVAMPAKERRRFLRAKRAEASAFMGTLSGYCVQQLAPSPNKTLIWAAPNPWANDWESFFDPSNSGPRNQFLSRIDVFQFYIGTLVGSDTMSLWDKLPNVVEAFKGTRTKIAIESGGLTCLPGVSAEELGETMAKNELVLYQGMKAIGIGPDYLVLDGPEQRALAGGCIPDLNTVAKETADYLTALHAAMPELQVGLLTNYPLWDNDLPTNSEWSGWLTSKLHGVQYGEVLHTFVEAAKTKGDRYAFLHADNPFSPYTDYNPGYVKQRLEHLRTQAAQEGLPFGLTLNTDRGLHWQLEDPLKNKGHPYRSEDLSNDSLYYNDTLSLLDLWTTGNTPMLAHVKVQSWHYAPFYLLPETTPYSFSNLVASVQSRVNR